jgi:RNA polymerase sigma-70 factor (ECF subfamily)
MSPANAALAGLYQAHASELRAFARHRLGCQEADDVVQDTYLHLLLRGTAATLDQPRPYLFRIAANLTVDIVRKTKVRLRYTEQEPEFACTAGPPPCPEAAAARVTELRRLESCLAELPRLWREAFLLCQLEELSRAEIAERLGVSIRTIDRYVAKALAHLREKLDCGSES